MVGLLDRYSRRRLATAIAISVLPTNGLRVGLYRRLLGYDLGAGARIGFSTLICCDSFRSGPGLSIGRQTVFLGPLAVECGAKVVIGRANRFTCGASAASADKAHMGYRRRLVLGDGVLVNDEHYFDVYGEISIGAGTWVAGVGSQFWTHGASVMDRDIAVGENCYLGSAVRFAPGAGLGGRNVLGLGSVVVSRLADEGAVVAGFPARKLRDIDPSDARQFVFEAE